MNYTQLTIQDIEFFLLVFSRTAAIILLLPIFGSDNIPNPLKMGLALILSFLVLPFASLSDYHQELTSVYVFILYLVKEIAVGLVIGYITTFLFAAVQFGGMMVDRQMGFALVQSVDPLTNLNSSITGQLHVILFTILFLLLNGHYFLLLAVKSSFEIIPVLGVDFHIGQMNTLFIKKIGDVFILALRFAAPAFIILTLTSIALGVVARTVPQINVFFVGMPLKILLGLVTTIIVLPILFRLFKSVYMNLIEDIWKLLYLMV